MRLAQSFIIRVLAVFVLIQGVLAQTCLARSKMSSAVKVSFVTDEAEAVLAVLAKKGAGEAIIAEDWRRIFSSEGYTRLKKRELSMRRSFEDSDFKAFILSDQLSAQAQALAAALKQWRHIDPSRAAHRALAYLPKNAKIQAKIYPVIKPRQNSFVFDLETDPAIFLYLDPAVNPAKLENTLAHELHHLGHGTVCPTKKTNEEIARQPKNMQTVLTYMRAFGEGFAMLAAAGGPGIHPHAVSDLRDRARWDRDVANFDADLRKVEKFFLDVLANRLSDQQIGETIAPFYGEQGPWYTVGWRMSVLIEKKLGRPRLVASMCDPRELLVTYNSAAARHNRKSRKPLALWSPALLEALSKTRVAGITKVSASGVQSTGFSLHLTQPRPEGCTPNTSYGAASFLFPSSASL
jgi:hypothetical protein